MRCLLFAALAGTAHAQIELPLNGYCRAGKCMPVKVQADQSLRQLIADGAIPTHIAAEVEGILPMLILGDSPAALRLGETQIPLRPLTADQRLVGVAGNDASLASDLFPGQTIITVPLDASRPFSGPMMAWETLDAVVLDAGPEPARIPDLLSAGITIIVRSQRKPDANWPWQRMGEAWVLRYELAGPSGAIGGETAYLPTQAWTPGRSAQLRRQIVLAGVLIFLLLASTLLIRSKYSIAAMIAVAIVCGGAIEAWRRSQPPLATAGGAIVVHSKDFTQRDEWEYLAAGASIGAGSTQLNRPIVASTGHASLIDLRIECDKDAPPRWHFTLPPHARLATLRRTIAPATQPPTSQLPATSPLYELARQAYLSPHNQIAGQVPDRDWPDVIIAENEINPKP